MLVLYVESQPWGIDHHIGQIYYFGFFATYLASAVLLFFICIEVFRSALAAFPGITKLAIVIFRWAAVVSMIVSLTSISYAHKGIYIIADISYGLMRSVSVLELCLLAFLCLSMNALRLSVRDMAFGIALGFGLMSSTDFILASLVSRITSLTDPLQFVYESLILAHAGDLGGLLRPARAGAQAGGDAGKLDHLSLERNCLRTGPHGNQVAVQQPANSFFLTDVERVVEKVLARNMKGRESET